MKGGGGGGGWAGAVDERCVTLGGGCTVQRYEALQGGGGMSSFPEKSVT